MTSSMLEDDIGRFISRTFLFEFGTFVTKDTDLFSVGLIDSYGLIELVKFLEHTYDIALTDDDLASTELASLAGIVRLVAERKGVPASGHRE